MLMLEMVFSIIMLMMPVGLIGTWAIPYIRNEYLTFFYGEEFIGREVESGWFKKADTMRVIQYHQTEAKIYYVCDDYTSGNIYTFAKDGAGRWELDRWKTVWSSSGSASEVMWPYFWHIVYGRI